MNVPKILVVWRDVPRNQPLKFKGGATKNATAPSRNTQLRGQEATPSGRPAQHPRCSNYPHSIKRNWDILTCWNSGSLKKWDCGGTPLLSLSFLLTWKEIAHTHAQSIASVGGGGHKGSADVRTLGLELGLERDGFGIRVDESWG